MVVSLRSLAVPTVALSLMLGTAPAFGQNEQADQNYKLYDSFAHFVLVAQPDLAVPLGEELLALSNEEFLAAVERDLVREFPKDFRPRMENNPQLSELYDQLEDKYEAALTERSRDEAQIRADLELLGGTERQYRNAVERLKVTGQYAAPIMLETLQDAQQSRLHPRLVRAMKEVGVELVYPMAVALPHLQAQTQVKIADILGDIGYPEALPYLRQVTEGGADGNVKATCESAYNQILANADAPANATAAQLHLMLGEAKYGAGTRGDDIVGLDLATNQGIVWRYNNEAGLVMIPVPRQVYADVLAMQNARSALTLDPEYTQAVTLHLAANVRRENNLGADQDISYKLPNPATFYLLLSGPGQQNAVLSRGLDNADPAQALDAIEAMSRTVGNTVLLGSSEGRQPVLEALYYPDRRVRYTAAMTLAQAAPGEAFPGSVSVVPVLGQALRQSETLNAMVVAPDGTTNALVSTLEDIDFNATGAGDLDAANESASNAFSGVDVIVFSGDLLAFQAMYEGVKQDGMLSVAPIVAMVDSNVATAIRLQYPDVVTTAKLSADGGPEEADRLERIANQAVQEHGGDTIGADESLAYAEQAVALLEQIAGNPSIYDANDARTVLIGALDDDRATVATGAGQVLALLNEQSAQQGLAAAALSRRGDVQISLLNSLAESAKDFANMLDRETIDQLKALVGDSSGETALAAARALGALTERPTGDTSGFILGN